MAIEWLSQQVAGVLQIAEQPMRLAQQMGGLAFWTRQVTLALSSAARAADGIEQLDRNLRLRDKRRPPAIVFGRRIHQLYAGGSIIAAPLRNCIARS